MSSTKTKLLDSAQKNLLKGQYARAISEYRQIIQIDPSDMRHCQKLAEILTKANLKDEAVSEYISLAKHYIESVHYLKAIAVYKQIQKLEPTNPEIALTLASLNEKQGLIGNATAEYASAIQIYEKNGENLKALKVLESMLDLDPGNSAVRLRIAEKYFTTGNEAKSFNEFLALASDLKIRNDENGYMLVAEKITTYFKERAQELFSKIEIDRQEEDQPLPEPTPVEDMPSAELIDLQPPQASPFVAEDQTAELPKVALAVSGSLFQNDGHDLEEEDLLLIEDLEEIDVIEEPPLIENEQEWEEDIDLDLLHSEPPLPNDLIPEDIEGSASEIELLDELELDDIELVLESDAEIDDAVLHEVEAETPSQASDEATEAAFDLAGELAGFADEIDFDLIRTSSDIPFHLETDSGFKRNELDNEDTESHYSLGLAYKEMGLFDEAICEFIVASRSDSRKIDSLTLQAVCSRELGNTAKAVEILSDAMNLAEITDDELLGIKYELAVCQETLGEISLARQLYTEIMTVRPDFSDTASRIAQL